MKIKMDVGFSTLNNNYVDKFSAVSSSEGNKTLTDEILYYYTDGNYPIYGINS